MQTTIDASGRLVIPGRLRDEAGLRPGMLLDIRYQDGHIEIEPAVLTVKLEQRGAMVVAVPLQQVAPLSAEAVDRTRRAVQRDRSVPG